MIQNLTEWTPNQRVVCCYGNKGLTFDERSQIQLLHVLARLHVATELHFIQHVLNLHNTTETLYLAKGNCILDCLTVESVPWWSGLLHYHEERQSVHTHTSTQSLWFILQRDICTTKRYLKISFFFFFSFFSFLFFLSFFSLSSLAYMQEKDNRKKIHTFFFSHIR